MEKKKRGRPFGIYTPIKPLTQEEKRAAKIRYNTLWLLNTDWYCDVCNNSHNYTMAGKHCHLKTNKHHINATNKSEFLSSKNVTNESEFFVQ